MPRFMPAAALLLVLCATRTGAQESQATPKLTRAPKLVTFVEAEYPPDKMAAGVTADVLLSIEIGADGKVGNVEVVEGAGPDFDAAAVAAARRFVFEPAEFDGKPSPVKITFRYAFTVKQKLVKLAPQVNLEGTILERFAKTPMAGVQVKIKDLDVSAVTGADGTFGFLDVPPGRHEIEITGPQLVTVRTTETVAKDVKKTLRYFVEERDPSVDEEVVVRAARVKKETVETRIVTEEARRVPGTQGDTLKVVQNLPGVARSEIGSGALVVWGSAPQDTRVIVGGVEVPSLYHGGGLRSTVNSDLVQSIDLAPGSYNAAYGRGLGGLVRIELRELPPEGVHGYVAADTYDASAMLTGAAGKRLRVAVAGRYSYLDRLLGVVGHKDVNDVVPIPRYYDYQARVSLVPSKDEDLSLVLLGSDDRLRRTVTSDDPSSVRTQSITSGYRRALLRWSRIEPDGSSFFVVPSIGDDTSRSTFSYGDVPVSLKVDARRLGLRAGWRRRAADWVTFSAGVDAQAVDYSLERVGSLVLPAREGDVVVFGQSPAGGVNADRWRVREASAGLYGIAEVKLGPLSLAPGLRREPYAIDGDRSFPPVGDTPKSGYTRMELALEPRIQAALAVGPRLTFTAGAGIYHQPPDPADLSSVFGNPELGLSSAWHASAGAALKLTGTLALEATGFYKYLDGLVSRSPSSTPPLAGALVQDGVGRSYGGQVLLRQQLVRGFFGWVSYSWIRSERQDHAGEPWRLFDYDQTHVLSVLASYDLGAGWEVGGRFRYATGAPRTPVVGATYDARDDLYEPVFGAQNSTRIPDFLSLDLRVQYARVIGRTKLILSLDVQNVTNRKNPEEVVYSYDFRREDYITGLPALALLGARLEF
jgi:TonB family protein